MYSFRTESLKRRWLLFNNSWKVFLIGLLHWLLETVDLRKWIFNTATIHVLDCDLLPYCQCLIFKPLTLNKPFSLKLNDARRKYFTCFKIDTLIIKKLSYRRVTARCVFSAVILPITTQQCRNYFYDKSWPSRWYEVGGLVGGNVS